MPQITSCPECSKKLRVPDELIGKKVKCPGCATMFIAEAVDQEEEAPPPRKAPAKAPPKPAERSRPDAVTSTPRGKSRDVDEEDEEEAPRPRGKSKDREDKDEEAPPKTAGRGRSDGVSSTPRGKSRDLDEEDLPRSRGKGKDREDEDDDRPSRSRRDDDEDDRRSRRDRDDDDDDDRPRGRRRDRYDEDSPAQQRRGWEKVRTGVNLVALAGWAYLSLVGIALLAVGVLLLIGGSVIASFIGGNPNTAPGNAASGAFGMMGGMCVFVVIILVIALAELVLRLIGMGMCMGMPQIRGSSMKGMAVGAFCCAAGALLLNLTGSFMSGFGGGLGGGGLVGLTMGGNYLSQFSGLVGFVGYVLWIVVLRSVCNELGDKELGGKIMMILIVQIIYGFLAVLLIVVMAFVIGVSMFSATGGGPGSAGAGMVVAMILGIVMAIGWFCIFGWYVMTLQKIRDLVEARGADA